MCLLRKPQRVPRLCYVTDRRSLSTTEPAEAPNLLLGKIAAAGEGGVDWIQIREKDLSGRALSSLTRDALGRAADAGRNPSRHPRIFVNDRLDVALATQANGVHFGERSLSPRDARRLVKTLARENDFLIGVSCHSLETAKAAEQSRADYIFFGPVFATPSKAAYGAPQGLERLAEVCRAVALPVLAIGGITLENAPACLSAGAAGIAAIRLFQEAPDIGQLVRVLGKLSA
jgi:thiamine-phosphate pyrophosphorylase